MNNAFPGDNHVTVITHDGWSIRPSDPRVHWVGDVYPTNGEVGFDLWNGAVLEERSFYK